MAVNHAESGENSILVIPDKALSEGAHVTFSSQNKFLVYGVQRGKNKKDYGPLHIHEISTKTALYNDYVRKLVNESYGVFLSLNREVKSFQDGRRYLEISKYSQKYRSILLACIEELDSAADASKDQELIELKDMFADIEMIWHLIQSLIIESQSGSRVLYKLLEWIKWHFCHAEANMEIITAVDEPAFHPVYWDTIIQFLLQGKIESARTLLGLHPNKEHDDFASLDELLKKMPMYFASSEMSLNEFRIRWLHWQDECKARLQRKEFSSDVNLECICKILCGETDVLSEKSYLCVNWYHLMISVQFYTDPCINLSSLRDVARAFYTTVPPSDGYEMSFVDTIILAALELDIMNVINLSCSFNDGWWFAVHMMDILNHGKFIDLNSDDGYAYKCRNNLLTNYAETLMSHSSLWEVGVGYFDHCPENGRELLELHLERIPLKTEAKARKLIHIARKRKMENLVKSIANVMIAKAMRSGNLGTALSWVMYSRDSKYADELADRWINDYVDKRKFKCFEILHNMGSCMLISDKLTFVGKYCEFHKLYSEKEFKAAGTLLVSLISSGIAQPSFQMIMLLDSLPLLESVEMTFSTKDTHQLMECLEDVSTRKDITSERDDKENLIRLALVRNLARSFVIEPGDSESEDGF